MSSATPKHSVAIAEAQEHWSEELLTQFAGKLQSDGMVLNMLEGRSPPLTPD
jgi:hypothetical protein